MSTLLIEPDYAPGYWIILITNTEKHFDSNTWNLEHMAIVNAGEL